MSKAKVKEIKGDAVKKVLTAAGWIPVDPGSFKLTLISIQDENGNATPPSQGFTFKSEGESITGDLRDLGLIKE